MKFPPLVLWNNRRRLTLCAGFLLWTVLPGTVRGEDAKAADLESRVERLESGLESLRDDIAALRQMLGELMTNKPPQGEAEAVGHHIEQRLDTLETSQQELIDTGQQLASQLQQDEAQLQGLSLGEASRTQVTVYGTFKVVDDSDADSVYDGQAFELVLSGQPSSRLGFFAEIEFERAATVGGERGGEVLLEQAHATYTFTPWLNLRAGILLMPFGNFNVDHYAPTRDVISKPLTAYAIAPSDWTDNGFGLLGEGSLGAGWTFDYELYTVAGLDADITAQGTRAARQPFGVDNNNNKALVGRAAWNRQGWLEIGLSAYHGKYDDAGRHDLFGWAVDSSFSRGRLRLTGELDRFEADRPSGQRPSVLQGWYARLVVDATPSWLRRGWHGQHFADARIGVVLQADQARLSGPSGGGEVTNRERRFTLGLNYRPSHQWVFKLNREIFDLEGEILQRGDGHSWLFSVGFYF